MLFGTVVKLMGHRHARGLRRASRDLGQTQTEFLLRLLNRNRNTEYGRKYRFDTVRGAADYRATVPIVEYNDLVPYMTAIQAGRPNVLTAEPVQLLVRTSGTTAHPKLIPITASSLQHNHRAMRLWLYSCVQSHPDILAGRMLNVTGSAREGTLDSGLSYGSASGLMPGAIPTWLHNAFAAPLCIAEVEDYSQRYYLLARAAFATRVSFIASPNPITLFKLCESADAHQEEIIRCIHQGWIADDLRNPTERAQARLPAGLDRMFRPDPARARFLEGVVRRTGRLSALECWPDLRLLGCWLGGSIGHQAPRLEACFPGVPRRDLGYMASEGVFTLPDEDGTPVGMLLPDTNYYEFVPENEDSGAAALTASDLEAGRSYRMLITNYQGLYRYDIRDIVQVHGHRHGLPLVSFARKAGNMLDMVGEKLHLNHFLYALERLRTRFGLDVRQFRVAPLPEQLRYEFFIDIRGDVDPQFATSTLLPALDDAMRECNIEYKSRRQSGRLQAPLLNIMSSNWEEQVRARDLAGGLNEVQYKWRPLAAAPLQTDRDHVAFTVG